MLLFAQNIDDDLRFAAWQVQEDLAFFQEQTLLSELEQEEILRHQDPLRAKEWLASRWLLHQLSGHPERLPLSKDAYSKPFFVGGSGQYCSLSHSKGTVAALLSGTDCGCDIQVLVDKMPRLAPKFMRPDESDWVQQRPHGDYLLLLHLFWTAKEAMYKAYGKKEVDFKGHLFLDPFDCPQPGQVTRTQGWLQKGTERMDYNLHMGYYEGESVRFAWTVAEDKT